MATLMEALCTLTRGSQLMIAITVADIRRRRLAGLPG